MKIYTEAEYLEKLHAQAATGPTVKLDGRKLKACVPGMIKGVERQVVNGKAAVVLYLEEESGEQYGVIMTRKMANDLTGALGRHPVVEEFFGMN